MKGILSFIIAVILYIPSKAIIWNVVYENIDYQSYTTSDIALLKLAIYSAVTAIIICLGMLIEGSSSKDKWYCLLAILFTVFGNWVIGALSEEKNTFWSEIAHLIILFYNIVNISLIYIVIRLNLDKK